LTASRANGSLQQQLILAREDDKLTELLKRILDDRGSLFPLSNT